MRWLVLVFALVSNSLSAQEKILWVPLQGTVELGLSPYITRAVKYAEDNQFDAIVLDVETFGGRVDAAVVIRDALLNTKLLTVAWVNKRAISAGALISLACKKVFFSPGSTMGAATPIQMNPQGGAQPVENKFVSYFRAELGATAERNGRDRKVAEAMVKATEEIKGLVAKDDVLTLTDVTAKTVGFSDGTIADKNELLKTLGFKDPTIEEFKINWAERIVRFLTDPTVSGVLMTVGVLGVFLELQAPGFGLPGIVGITCFAIYFSAKFLVHLAGWEEVLLLILGIILLAVEFLFLPGTLIAGILGAACMIAALVMTGISPKIPLDWNAPEIQNHLMGVGIAMVAMILGLLLAAYLMVRNPKKTALVMSESLDRDKGFVSASDLSFLQDKVGTALTDLHPSGKCQFDQSSYEVISSGSYIRRDAHVRVLSVEGSKIVVEEFRK